MSYPLQRVWNWEDGWLGQDECAKLSGFEPSTPQREGRPRSSSLNPLSGRNSNLCRGIVWIWNRCRHGSPRVKGILNSVSTDQEVTGTEAESNSDSGKGDS